MSRYVLAGLWVILAPTCFAETIGQAVKNGHAYAEFNLRLETVSQDNSL